MVMAMVMVTTTTTITTITTIIDESKLIKNTF